MSPTPRSPDAYERTLAGLGLAVCCACAVASLAGAVALLREAWATPWIRGTRMNPLFWIGTALLVLAALFAAAAVGLRRRLRGARTPAPVAELAFAGAATTSGRSVAVVLREGDLVLRHFEMRKGVALFGGVAMAVHLVMTLRSVGVGAPPSVVPFWIWALPFGPFLNRRIETHYPIDAFVAVEVLDRSIRLHRRGGDAGRPLEIALKSWTVSRLVEGLRAGHPEGLTAAPPVLPPAPRDETADVRAALRSWMPSGHSPRTTTLTVASIAASLLFGLAYRLDPSQESTFWGAIVCWGAAGALWFGSSARERRETEELKRLSGGPVEPIRVHLRSPGADPFAFLFPWTLTEIDVRDDRFVVTRRPRDVFEAVIVLGVAVLGGWLVFGALTPWHAAGYGLPLVLSGYPRRREDVDLLTVDQVRGFADQGGRGTLELHDEDGPRTLELRYESKAGHRLVDLVRTKCPRATVREPSWRSSATDSGAAAERAPSADSPPSTPDETLLRLRALADEARDGR